MLHFGIDFEHSAALIVLFGGILGASWGSLGGFARGCRTNAFLPPFLVPLGTHLGGKMGEDGAQDRQLGAKMGPTWRLFGDLGREKPKFQKLAFRLDGSTIFKVSGPLGKPILAHLGAMLAYLGPSWRHLGTTWRQDGTQERREANLQRPPWHKWAPPEAVRGR